MFPKELVDRFVDEIAVGIANPGHYIPPHVRDDLRSCSLAARCFRSQSQRHLLAHAQIFITRGETPAVKVQTLREILETGAALRQCIIYLTIDLLTTDPLDIDDGDVEQKFHDENLPPVLNMLAELRHLILGTGNHPNRIGVEWDCLSENIKTAFRKTRFTSPHLYSLYLGNVSISPYDFVYTWKSIKKIILDSVVMNMDEDTFKDMSTLDFRLENIRISTHKFPLHLALQNSQVLGGLRQFMVDPFGTLSPYSIRQIWNVIHIASKSLEGLVLAECFVTSIRPNFLTMDHFPSLRRLSIADDIIGGKACLETIYPFFKLMNPISTSKLEDLSLDLKWIMPIGSNSSYEDEVLLPQNGWRQLDALLASSQYPSLRKVYIAICLSASWEWRLVEPQRFARVWNIYRHIVSSLFPLLSCSDFIELDFHPRTGYHMGF